MKKKHQILILKAELTRLGKIIQLQETFLKRHHKHPVVRTDDYGEKTCAFCDMVLEEGDYEKSS